MLERLAVRDRIRRRTRLLGSLRPKPTARYCIKGGYLENLAPAYDDPRRWGDVVWQPDVYPRAAEIARELGIRRVVDVGCGPGNKLHFLAEFETVGIDIGPNLEACRTRYSEREWVEHDLDSEGPLPVSVEDSLVVCADVIEHLLYPERLLEKLRSARFVVLSTPDRDLLSGVSHNGPPTAPTHVREWNRREFRAFLESQGYAGRFRYTRLPRGTAASQHDPVRGLSELAARFSARLGFATVVVPVAVPVCPG